MPRWQDKVRVWFKEPAWRGEGEPDPGEAQEKWARGEFRKYDARSPAGLNLYVLMHFVPVLLLSIGFLQAESDMAWLQRAVCAGLIFCGLLSFGGIFESRKWVRFAEPARLIAMAGLLAAFGGKIFGLAMLDGTWFQAANITFAVVSLGWFLRYRAHFNVASWTPVPGNPEPATESLETT